jgi:hypothetical protein
MAVWFQPVNLEAGAVVTVYLGRGAVVTGSTVTIGCSGIEDSAVVTATGGEVSAGAGAAMDWSSSFPAVRRTTAPSSDAAISTTITTRVRLRFMENLCPAPGQEGQASRIPEGT